MSTPASPAPIATRRARDLAVAGLVALSLGGTMPYFGRLMNANERPRLLQAMAWVDTAELAVDGPAARGIGAGVDVARSPVDGRLYPNKPPGATLPAVVAYAGLRGVAALGGPTATLRGLTMLARVLGAVVPTLLLLLLLARRLRARGAGPAGDAAVLLLALATPLSSYARLLFGHSLAACLLLAGMLWLLDGTDPAEASSTRSWRRALGGGVLAASAITVEYLAVFAGIPLAVLLGLRWRQGTPRLVLVAAVAGALLPVAALAGYHAVVFGSPWATGYHHVVDAGFAQTHGRGLLGLGIPSSRSLFEHLLSPWGGLLVWAPVVALALVCSMARWRALDLEERLASSTLLLLVLVTLGLAQTGGWRVGPRYLVLVMPLAGYGLVGLLRAAAGRAVVGALVLGVALASAVPNALAASLFPHLIPHGNPWADLLLPLAAEGRIGYALLPDALARFMVLALPLGLLGWALWRVLEPSSPPSSRTRAVVFAAGSLLGIGLLVAGLAPPEHPEADADLRAVRSIWEPEGPRPAPRTELPPLPE